MTQDEEGVGIGFGKESYIQFYYNYDTPNRAKHSSLLLSNLLQEEVRFTAIPIDKFPFPNVMIKVPKEETPSVYHAFEIENIETSKRFKEQCRIMKESALEKRTVGG